MNEDKFHVSARPAIFQHQDFHKPQQFGVNNPTQIGAAILKVLERTFVGDRIALV